MHLNVISYNCNSIRKKIDIIRDLMNNTDILFLQEILLTIDNVDFMDGIHKDFNYVIVPSPTKDKELGRPQGGLVIFYRKHLSSLITPVHFSEQFLGITLTLPEQSIPEYLLINAYLPCDTRSCDALVDYKAAVADLINLVEIENINKIVIAGDINADPFKGRFYREIEEFIELKHFIVADRCSLPINSFTYISTHDTTSWLDHVIVSQPGLAKDIEILYEATISDHVPLKFKVEIDSLDSNFNIRDYYNTINNTVKWDQLTKCDKKAYADRLEIELQNYYNLGMQCRDSYCTSEKHILLLKNAYIHLINSFKNASQPFISNISKKKFKLVPGWNDHCKDLYAIARSKYKIWNEGGRFRIGAAYEQMKTSRCEFKNALKQCKKDSENIKKAKLQQSFQFKNKTAFWRDIKKLKNNKTKLPTIIDKESDPVKIAEIFSAKYRNILNDQNCNTKTEVYDENISAIRNECKNKINLIRFTPKQVSSSIKSLNDSLGFDRIHSSHLKLANNSLYDFLSRLFTAFICHGYVPNEMIAGEIRPTIKNKHGNLNTSENYRPVMNSPNLLKVFEYCLQQKIVFNSNSRQFGFKKGSSTQLAVTILKETITHYKRHNSKVYASFVDLSKAFDKVNLNILICKLREKNISPFIINTLDMLYRNQNIHINFNSFLSTPWKITNGLRQGGILSPALFCLYIDDILVRISKLQVGCRLSNYNLNLLAYADDLILLCPSSYGLQILLNKLAELLENLMPYY